MARWRAVTPRSASCQGNPASTTKRSSPACECSLLAIASPICCIAVLGKRRCTCHGPLKRCLSIRIPILPPPRGAAATEAASPAVDQTANEIAQNGPQQSAGGDGDKKQYWKILVYATVGTAALWLRQRFALNHAENAVHTGQQAIMETTLPELRQDDFLDDALGDGVGQRAFQAVANLDAQRAVVLRYQQQGAVVHALAPQFPLLGHTDGILLDGFRLGGRHDQHGDLAAFLPFEGG